MKKDMDKIQFESRSEIHDIASALDTFKNEHPTAEENKTVERLFDLLDVMDMEW